MGTYHSMSYPVLSPSEEAARELAAVNLLAQVESLEAGGLVTASAASAVAGLTALVAEHSAGLLAKHVPHQYRYKEGHIQIITRHIVYLQRLTIHGVLQFQFLVEVCV